MAENLNRDVAGSRCYGDNPDNCEKYGRLYNWETAKIACPNGWHLPSDAEWTTLTNFAGTNAGTKLKSRSGWNNGGNGTDNFGFAALPGGYGYSGSFESAGDNGYWWSATEKNTNTASYRDMRYNSTSVINSSDTKAILYSARCLLDN